MSYGAQLIGSYLQFGNHEMVNWEILREATEGAGWGGVRRDSKQIYMSSVLELLASSPFHLMISYVESKNCIILQAPVVNIVLKQVSYTHDCREPRSVMFGSFS